jgi:flagellar protein FliS
MTQAAHDTYLRIQTETASPGQLIIMLYDALLRSLARAEEAIDRGDIEVAHRSLLRSQDVILELIASLDLDAEGEAGVMARQMAPLYEYIYRRTLDASLRKDVAPVQEAVRLVLPLRAAWQSALETIATDAGGAAVEVLRG